MYNVLIIDDEEPAREAIKLLADWTGSNVYDVFEAWDGKSGLKLIEDKKPDIVFVDMKMPGIDGAELLRTTRERFPELAIIVISGYDDYEYTRQALRSKVVDYLLKPIKRIELNNAIKKAIDSIDTRRKIRSENIDRNMLLNLSIPSLKEKILTAAIEGSLSRQMKEVYGKSINTNNSAKYYSAIILRVMNIAPVKDRFFKDTGHARLALLNTIDENLNKKYESFSMINHKYDNEIIVIVSADKYIDDTEKDVYLHLIKSCKRKIQELFGIISIAGVGDFFEGITRLKNSYLNAEKYINSVNLFCDSDLVCYKVQETTTSKISLLGKKDLLFSAFEGGSLTYTKDIISEFLAKVEKNRLLCLRDCDRIFGELLLILNNFSIIKGIDADEIITSYQNIPKKIYCFKQLKTLMLEITELFYNRVKKQLKNDNLNVYEIKEYIENNYHHDIRISNFTQKYFLSREYLMKLFKNEFGCGIYEYVLIVRMQKAKELIADSKIKIQSIAQMLGYSDNNYFNYHQLFFIFFHYISTSLLLKNFTCIRVITSIAKKSSKALAVP
jgi:two-component system response regulator YesN